LNNPKHIRNSNKPNKYRIIEIRNTTLLLLQHLCDLFRAGTVRHGVPSLTLRQYAVVLLVTMVYTVHFWVSKFCKNKHQICNATDAFLEVKNAPKPVFGWSWGVSVKALTAPLPFFYDHLCSQWLFLVCDFYRLISSIHTYFVMLLC